MSAGTSRVRGAQTKVVIAGHVDHGKSTLIGRLLHDTGSFPAGRLEQLQRAAARRGAPFEWANLMDGLQAERDQNITIDTAQVWFRTREREYVLIDAPGHREFIKNMVTGAAAADAALLIVDAAEGMQEQSRRHGYLLALLGLRQVAVVVNKMDVVGYREDVFAAVAAAARAFLEGLGIPPVAIVPVSARTGENLAAPATAMPWWSGLTVVGTLDAFDAAPPAIDGPLRFAVQDVYRFDERRLLAGRVESGTLRVGDRLLFSPGGRTSTVRSIERWNSDPREQAEAGESIAITLDEQVFVERGAVGAREAAAPFELPRFHARLLWLGREPLRIGRPYRLKLLTAQVDCELESVDRVVDAATLETRAYSDEGVRRYEVADAWIRAKRPVAFDVFSHVPSCGRFVLVDGYHVAGGGIVLDEHYPQRTADAVRRGAYIYWNEGKVSPLERAQRDGHPGLVVWLTGLPGSGKSTIAMELERQLFNRGRHAYVLDGDNVRHGLCSDLGFSAEDRRENIRRVGEVARLFADAGTIVITAFISPFEADRALARRIAPPGGFIEVFVNAPSAVCEQRDPKGLYAKARAGEIASFTGVSSPYEPPSHPEVELRTDHATVEGSVAQVLDYIETACRSASRTSWNT